MQKNFSPTNILVLSIGTLGVSVTKIDYWHFCSSNWNWSKSLVFEQPNWIVGTRREEQLHRGESWNSNACRWIKNSMFHVFFSDQCVIPCVQHELRRVRRWFSVSAVKKPAGCACRSKLRTSIQERWGLLLSCSVSSSSARSHPTHYGRFCPKPFKANKCYLEYYFH